MRLSEHDAAGAVAPERLLQLRVAVLPDEAVVCLLKLARHHLHHRFGVFHLAADSLAVSLGSLSRPCRTDSLTWGKLRKAQLLSDLRRRSGRPDFAMLTADPEDALDCEVFNVDRSFPS